MAFALPAQWQPYWQLARLDKPIGTLLLLWPTLWALWLAADGLPPLSLLVIFIAGVFVMRSAGCVINDYADRNVDGYVKRTASRPLPAGRLSTTQALLFFFLLVVIAFVLVWQLNQFTIYLLCRWVVAGSHLSVYETSNVIAATGARDGIFLVDPNGLWCSCRTIEPDYLVVIFG